MQQNLLNITELDLQTIIRQCADEFSNRGFGNLSQAKITELLIEIFGSATDFINYYIERRAEEGFFDTLMHLSSAIMLSRNLGYSIQRPIPCRANVKITLRGKSGASVPTGAVIQIPRFTAMTAEGKPFLTKQTYTYVVQATDAFGSPAFVKEFTWVEKLANGSFWLRTDSELVSTTSATEDRYTIELIQGEFRTFELPYSENPQAGALFQNYSIRDLKFSNLFGTEDLGYDPETGEWDLTECLTQISVTHKDSPPFEAGSLYKIDRRSLISHDTLYRDTWSRYFDANGVEIEGQSPKVCVVRTALNGGVELLFGEGRLADYPRPFQSIHVRYLATDGAIAVRSGVIGNSVSPTARIVATHSSGNVILSNYVEISLLSDIFGGADLESIDSIKLNAPSLFNSLDRLVSKGDYVAYLRSLKSPLAIKQALVWGEQEEARKAKKRGIKRFSNVIFYSVLGDLYRKDDEGLWRVKRISDTTVDGLKATALLEGFDYDEISKTSYLNALVLDNYVKAKREGQAEYDAFFANYPEGGTDPVSVWADYWRRKGHPVQLLDDKLNVRGQLTTKHQYLTPIIQNFRLEGEVVLRDFADIESTKAKIESKLYEFLNGYVNFNTQIYKSAINDIIVRNNPEVVYANLKLVPDANTNPAVDKITDWDQEPEFNLNNVALVAKRLRYLNHADTPNKRIAIDTSTGFFDVGNTIRDWDFQKWILGSTIRFRKAGTTAWRYGEVTRVVGINPPKFFVSGQKPADILTNPTAYFGKWFWEGAGTTRKAVTLIKNSGGAYVLSYASNLTTSVGSQGGGAIITWGLVVDSTDSTLWANGGGQNFSRWDQDCNIEFNSVAPLPTGTLEVEVITNLDSVMASVGFCPKGYLIEGITNALKSQIQKLFEVIVCKYCEECPDAIVPDTFVQYAISYGCVPLFITREFENVTKTADGDCLESTKKITWSEWYKAQYAKDYDDWTRCSTLSVLTQEDVYEGKYNSNLDISEFEAIVIPKSAVKPSAPDRKDGLDGWVTEVKLHHRIGGISERWFATELARDIIVELRRIANKKAGYVKDDFYTTDKRILALVMGEWARAGEAFDFSKIKAEFVTAISSSAYVEDLDAVDNVERFLASKGFLRLMWKLRNTLRVAILSGMLDKDGNIVNYSLKNEIVQIESKLEFKYKA